MSVSFVLMCFGVMVSNDETQLESCIICVRYILNEAKERNESEKKPCLFTKVHGTLKGDGMTH